MKGAEVMETLLRVIRTKTLKVLVNLTLVLSLIPNMVFAADQSGKVSGYSYFSFGYESIDYEERLSSTVPGLNLDFSLRSDGSVSSPTVRSGGLTVINNLFDLSIDTSATFAPQSSDETWYMDINYPPANHVGEKAVQTNSFSYTDATSLLLLHYKFSETLRVVGGVDFMYHQFKRTEFNFISPLTTTTDYLENCITAQGSDECLLLEQVEEGITNFQLAFGAAYELGSVANNNIAHSAKVIFSTSVWSDVVNSDNTDVTFDETGGYSLLAEWRSSFRIVKGMNLGVFASYKLTERNEQKSGIIEFEQNGQLLNKQVTIPEATTSSISVGISGVWSL